MGYSIPLPDYYEDLNKNSIVYVVPFKHFGTGWGEVNGNELSIHVSEEGTYNILVFGDRKDKIAIEGFNKYGVEYI
ncbi:MAG: hypothetical protein GY817_00015 [bacterium]|nr:hypothetical protein [bacterium]